MGLHDLHKYLSERHIAAAWLDERAHAVSEDKDCND